MNLVIQYLTVHKNLAFIIDEEEDGKVLALLASFTPNNKWTVSVLVNRGTSVQSFKEIKEDNGACTYVDTPEEAITILLAHYF